MAKRRGPYLVRIVRARPRLYFSGLIAVILLALLPAEWRLAPRLLVAWDFGIALYLVLAYALMRRARVGDIRQQAAREDEGRYGILVLSSAAALASLAAIVAELGVSPELGSVRQVQVTLAILTIPLSWAFTHTIFALHYAHEYYDENDGRGGGLTFPGGEEPDYWDFVYFAFVVGMTSQVSDVAVVCKPIRRTVTAHGILSFVFNTALLALTVNLAASTF